MNKTARRVLAILLMILAAAGCAPNQAPAPQSGPEAGDGGGAGTITLTIWAGTGFKNVEGYESRNYGDWEKLKAKEFQKLHPNVSIQVVSVPFAEIEQKVNVAVAGNNPPDILYDNVPIRISKHARNDVLEKLDDVIRDDREDWKEEFLAMGTVGGGLYALPLGSMPQVVFLNRTLFENKGVSVPADRSWTWSEMKDALRKVVDKNIYGTAFFAKNEQADQLMINHLLAAGAQWANRDFTRFTLNSPEGVEALSFMLGLADEGLAAPGTATMDLNANLELFKQGRLAVLNNISPIYREIEVGIKNGTVDHTVVPYGIIPVVKEGVTPRITMTGENGYAIFKQDDPEKRRLAFEFVKFLVQPENVRAINKATYGIAARKSGAYDNNNPDAVELFRALNTLEVVDLGKDKPFYSELRQKFYPEMQAAFLKSKTPQQALDQFVEKANTLAAGGQ